MQKTQSIVEYMGREVVKGNIQDTLGQRTPQFIASVASLVNSNPAIAECEQQSILSSCLVAAALNLPVNQNLGLAYIIPYNSTAQVKDVRNGKELVVSKKVKKAQFQMGWKGFVQLALRTKRYKFINTTDVRDGEFKGKNRMTGEDLFEWIQDDKERATRPIIGYLGYFELIEGFSKTNYMTVEQLTGHANKYSQSYRRNSDVMNQWRDDPDAMSRKTVIKLLISKFGPMSSELERAIQADQAIIEGDQYEYPDNKNIDADEVARDRENARIIRHIENSKTVEELEECRDAIEFMKTTDEAWVKFHEKELELNKVKIVKEK